MQPVVRKMVHAHIVKQTKDSR